MFLPAAGNRNGTNVYDVGYLGDYWSSSADEYGASSACYVDFGGDYVYPDFSSNRCIGQSVRLVR